MIILTIFFAVFFFINSPFKNGSTINGIMLILSNSFLPAAVVVLVVPFFIWVGRTGLFDVVAFGLIAFGESFKKDITHKYESPYQYRQVQEQKRHDHQPYLIPYFIIGFSALVLAVIFTVIYMCM